MGAFVILLCLTPDDFTRERRAPGWEMLKGPIYLSMEHIRRNSLMLRVL